MNIDQIHSVSATNTPAVYSFDVTLTDIDGETDRVDYVSYPDDPYGLNPEFRKWLVDNEGEYEILPYVPYVPTPEELREQMLPISKRQLSLTLVRNGYPLASVTAAIFAIPEGTAQDEASIEWATATTFRRLNPTLLGVAAALGISDTKLDQMWDEALLIN